MKIWSASKLKMPDYRQDRKNTKADAGVLDQLVCPGVAARGLIGHMCECDATKFSQARIVIHIFERCAEI
jgi:hypothetical protein